MSRPLHAVDEASSPASPRFATYDEFWPYYVAMHGKAITRKLHFLGTTTGALIALSGVLTGHLRRVLALPAIGYGVAWPSHWIIEKNNPASFGHPLWSFRGDQQMMSYLLRGRDGELSEVAHRWLATHPEDRTAGNWSAGPILRAA
ncbi:MAG: Mpo1-like protein [Jatrophihabitans sp.]